MDVLWVVGWVFLVYESPGVHPRICKTELDYIEYSLAETGVTEREVNDIHNVFRLFQSNSTSEEVKISVKFDSILNKYQQISTNNKNSRFS